MEPTLKTKRTKSPEQALAALMRLCARAEKSSGDALRLMRSWGVEPAAREGVLRQLIAQRFIDDERYTEAFVREKSRLNGWGIHKIRQALQRKGVDRALIEQGLQKLDTQQNSLRLKEQLQRKARSVKAANAYEKRTKLVRYGLSLGFDYELVGECVTSILQADNESCDTFFD